MSASIASLSPPGTATGCPFHTAATASAAATNACPFTQKAADFDPFEPAYLQDPPEYLRWAREQAPVFYSPKLDYWVVARYEDIQAVFRDHLTFSPANALEKITPTGEEANAVLASYDYAMSRTLVNEDEPAHMPRRRVLMEPFTPEALKHHEPMVRQLAREYVDRFIERGRADLVAEMLWEVPLTIALHFLGVPEEDMDTLRRYSIAHTVNTWGRPQPHEQVAVAHAVGNFWQFAGQVLEKMRQDPSGPGWMKYGIRQQALHPEVVTDSYLHSMMMAGIVAAHETTANATANALRLLLQNPAAWEALCKDPSLIPNAVEECLRHSGPIVAWRRVLTQPARVGEVDLPAGARLLVVMASANHDEGRFSDADLFDIRRDDASAHLSFGYGAHQCMGKNLARMEMQIFLEEFSRRLPHMKLAPQRFSYVSNTSFRGPEHLWVEWDPARNPERSDPALRGKQVPIRIGEPSRHTVTRPLVVQSATQAAEGVLHLRLADPQGQPLPRWRAGAHIDIECGDTGLSRQYSLCGDPTERGVYEVAVLRDPASRGGSAWIHQHATSGAVLRIRGPRNHFHFDPATSKAIFIAGGIGITPVSAMAREAQAAGIDYELHYSGSRRSTMAMRDELAALHGERLHLYVSEEGRRNDLCALLRTPDARTRIYACGPARLLDALEAACAHWPEDALHVEHFSAALSALDPAKEQAFEIELKASGLTVCVAADQTVLAALRAANIDVQSDCGEGLCGSCEVRVLAGTVDHRDKVLTRAEREANDRMMTCCSRARAGECLVLDL